MFLALLVQPALAYNSWPGSSATDITAGINAVYSGFEPSGAFWNSVRGTYFVNGDDGNLFEISSTGTVMGYWWITGNLEGMTFIDSSSSVAYFLDENTSTIFGYNLDTRTKTGELWNFFGYDEALGLLNADDNNGVEGLTWLPDGFHSFGTTTMGGVFAVAYQHDGDIYFYEPKTATTYDFLYELHTSNGFTDNAGLDFDQSTGKMFAVYDGSDVIEEWTCSISGFTLNKTYFLSGSYAQEGVAFRDDCSTGLAEVLIADDGHNTNGIGHVYLYENFPITCLTIDVDRDGYDSTADCNDSIAAINPGATEMCDGVDNDCDGVIDTDAVSAPVWYQDYDADGYGSAVSVAACTMPTNYASNNLDCNDTNPAAYPGAYEFPYDGVDEDCNGSDLTDVDGDGYSDIYAGGTDCDDYDPSVHDWFTYYFDRDGDGLGSDITNRVCSITPPVDHVTNSDDTNDLIPNAGIEIRGDLVDNDGDGRRDEYNTLTENGVHPYFSTLDPMPYSIGDEILSTAGFFSGEISVSYEDNSVYRYQIFSTASATRPRILPINNSAYLVVIRNSDAALVNGYTGGIMSTRILKSRITEQIMVDWLVATLGLQV